MSRSPSSVEWLRLLLYTLFILFSWTTLSYGEAFRILDQSASATGQGTAFAAQADDASALYFNPAGMTQLRGVQFSIGTLLIGGGTTFTSPTGVTVDGNFGDTIVNPPPSQLYITANLQDLGVQALQGWSIGIGVNNPFGIKVEYPDNSPFSQILTKLSLPLLDIKPTVAYKVNDYISVGGGLDIYTFSSLFGEGQAEIQARSGPQFVPLGIPLNTPLEANGTDTALGFNASLLMTPLRNDDGKPLVNLAFVYRSQTDLDLEGDFLANGVFIDNLTTTVALPQIITGAIAVWPIRNQAREWKVEVDLDYADWSDFQNLNLNLSNGVTVPFPRNYGDAYIVQVGTEYKWLRPSFLPEWNVALRGGYVYSETPIPSEFFEPGVPDSDYNALSIGLGLMCNETGKFLGLFRCDSFGAEAIGLDLAYQGILYQQRGINNNINTIPPNPSPLDGEWDSIIHVGALNLRMNF